MADADTAPTREALDAQARQLETLDRLAQRFGSSLATALSGGTSSGRELSGVLDRVASSLTASLGTGLGATVESTLSVALRSAAQAMSASAGLFGFGGALPFANGGVLSASRVMPFASGGVVAAPTYFPMQGGLGLMGERGAEAIVPLARGPNGQLGIQASGQAAPSVTVNIAATDLESFRRSEAQVSAALARAVARGRRAL